MKHDLDVVIENLGIIAMRCHYRDHELLTEAGLFETWLKQAIEALKEVRGIEEGRA